MAHALEAAAGRVRGERFAPRELDVDLLLYGERVSSDPALTLPHPRMAERRFVLVPLAEIAPGWRVPPEGRTVAELLAATGDRGRVERVGWSERGGGSGLPPGGRRARQLGNGET